MLHTLRFFSSKCRLFHNANFFGSCVIHVLYTGCAKIKKKIRRQKVNIGEEFIVVFLFIYLFIYNSSNCTLNVFLYKKWKGTFEIIFF